MKKGGFPGGMKIHKGPKFQYFISKCLCIACAGVRMEPTSWEEAKAAVAEGSVYAISRLGRHPLDLKKYEEFRQNNVLSKYQSVSDYLFATIFQAECVQDLGEVFCIGRF